MFKVAILIGIYSYIIFTLGILGLLFREIILFLTISYLTFVIIYFLKIYDIKKLKIRYSFSGGLSFTALLLIILQAAVNFLGALGPELSYDALWYHLTLPKIFLLTHKISHIGGNIFLYSDMPKLIEMIYMAGLSIIGNEILIKLMHYTFGLLTLFIIYKISSKYLSKRYSLLAALIFYSNLVVGWESITAYVDLVRTFFEIMAFWGFLNWIEYKSKNWLIISALMLGMAICTKVVSISSILIFIPLIIYCLKSENKSSLNIIKNIILYVIFSVAVAIPWFLFSYINTGNPIYPYLSINFDNGYLFKLPNNLNIINFNDPISPIYLIVSPLIFYSFKKFNSHYKLICFYVLIAFSIWFLTQERIGTRFLLPYLPVFSILTSYMISIQKSKSINKFLIFLVLFISIFSIGYRSIANVKFIPVLLGQETKNDFLAKHLNFNFGDFADIDNYFKNNIRSSDNVLLYGFHNLYYVDFPFIDSSFVKKGDAFNYIATQNTSLPKKFKKFNQIYYNKVTNVKLYTADKRIWVY